MANEESTKRRPKGKKARAGTGQSRDRSERSEEIGTPEPEGKVSSGTSGHAIPRIEYPRFEMPRINIPTLSVPKIEFPVVQMPKIDPNWFTVSATPSLIYPTTASLRLMGGGSSEDQAASRAKPPPAVPPRANLLKRHAPPQLWPEAVAVRKMIGAAEGKREVNLLVLSVDIRHSTDLMKEAIDLLAFGATLERFVNDSRSRIWDSQGWFDKFTGDGWLAYWPTTASSFVRVFRRVFSLVSDLVREFRDMHGPQFASNSQNFNLATGLGFGVDVGNAYFVRVAGDVTIVGPSVVGAVRMAAPAPPGSIIVNGHVGDLLADALASGKITGFNLEEIAIRTKEYTQQRAFRIPDVGSEPPDEQPSSPA